MNRAAFCVADDFFDTVQNILATKSLAYGVQEPFDNASEPKNIHGSLHRSKPFMGPAHVQAISSQLHQNEKQTRLIIKPGCLGGLPDLYRMCFLHVASGSGFLVETHGLTGLVQCERWMACLPDHLRNAPNTD